jgi:hypothetical protein
MDHWTSVVGYGTLMAAVGFGAAFWPNVVEFRDLTDDLEFCQFDLATARTELETQASQAVHAKGRWQDWQGWAEDANKARTELEAELGKTRTALFAARAYQEQTHQKLLAALAKSAPPPQVVVIPAPIRKAEPKARKRRYAVGKKKAERQDVHSWAWF